MGLAPSTVSPGLPPLVLLLLHLTACSLMFPGSPAGSLDGGEAAPSDAEGTDLLSHQTVTSCGPVPGAGPDFESLFLTREPQ